ncbi:hypothetical protein E2C01_075573 [Portunus trituberculatus]|uniref:Uncharacterized protein n=1 Tax=Portunus trituberculatus TaxID=210409 RepID=A0A5B7IB10_PORTR|nr:hypothetical protein [Portunus trituberculatus]
MLLRSPVRGQTKWFLRRLPVDSGTTRCRDRPIGAVLCWMVGFPENSLPEVRQIPPPRCFVDYYSNLRGNFIHASRYLSKEIGTIPEGNLKKYGKGVLVRAKDFTQIGCCNISTALMTACLKL